MVPTHNTQSLHRAHGSHSHAASSAQTSVTQPLRDEHKELAPSIEQLRAAADLVGQASSAEVRRAAEVSHAFLTQHLIPHAMAEDAVLYPAVDQLMGAPGATGTMRREHVVVGRLTQELGSLVTALERPTLPPATAAALRRVLYGLYALVTTHFDNEEEVYLPLLEAKLSPAEAGALFERMEAAASTAHGSLPAVDRLHAHGHDHAG